MKRIAMTAALVLSLAAGARAEVIGNPKTKIAHTEKDVHAKTCKACTVQFATIEAAVKAGYRLCAMSSEARAMAKGKK